MEGLWVGVFQIGERFPCTGPCSRSAHAQKSIFPVFLSVSEDLQREHVPFFLAGWGSR